MSEKPQVVFITSIGHSGSTLLDLLIGSHSRVVSAGEIKVISRDKHPRRCTCGVLGMFNCPFWLGVGEHVRRTSNVELHELKVANWDARDFESHNLALFEAIRDQSGCNVIVDSSKNRARLAALLRCTSFEVKVIHLIRSPFGVAHSLWKKGEPVGPTAVHWAVRTYRLRHMLKSHPHQEIRYEQLVSRTPETVARIMAGLDLEFEPEQLDFATQTRHNIGGNHMRYGSDSTIVHDLSWRSGLTARQKILVALLTLPVGVPGSYRLYRNLHKRAIR